MKPLKLRRMGGFHCDHVPAKPGCPRCHLLRVSIEVLAKILMTYNGDLDIPTDPVTH